MVATDIKNKYAPLLSALLLVLLAFTAYVPVIAHGNFIWDDNEYIIENMTLRQDRGLYDIWFRPTESPQYYPLVFTTFFIEMRLYGLEPRGYIVLNVMLHAASVCLLYVILKKIKVPGAWLAAALFAVHPMTLESVAWITERKNTMVCFFSLAAAWAYLVGFMNEDTPARKRWIQYGLATLLYIAALMSKTSCVVVPPMMLIVLWWHRKRFPMRDIKFLSVWLILALLAGLNTAYVEYIQVGAVGEKYAFTLPERLLIIGRAWCFYPAKFIWPHPLSIFYPRWNILSNQLWQYMYPLAAVAIISTLWLMRRRMGVAPFVYCMLYTVAIAPVLGILNIYFFRYSFVADHFAYLALIPLAAGVAALISRALARLSFKPAYTIASVLLLTALMPLSWNRAYAYSGLIPLWEETLRVNPGSQAVWSLYGEALLKQGRFADAKDAITRALNIPPKNDKDLLSLADAYIGLRQYDMAEVCIQQYLKTDPVSSKAYDSLGLLRFYQKRPQEAVIQFLRAHQISPRGGVPAFHAGVVLAEMGLFDKATDCFTIATQVNPRWAHAWDYLGRCLAMQGKLPEAIASFERASELDNKPDYRQDLDRAHADLAARQKIAPMTQPVRP